MLVFLKIETETPASLVTTKSSLPSASRSPRAKLIGLVLATATSIFAAKLIAPTVLVFLKIEKEALL